MSDATQEFYEKSYSTLGSDAQRRYPNEELCRFMGRRFFPLPQESRSGISILEVGCGSGANLWMLAREGFDSAGIDISAAAIALCEETLRRYNAAADLRVGSMLSLPWPDGFFSAVIDVFSSYCLSALDFDHFLAESHRVLAPKGHLFIYTPPKASDAWTNPGPSRRIDDHTLEGISRVDSPFSGNAYPFRFTTPDELREQAGRAGFAVTFSETTGRTYRSGQEYFEFVVAEVIKIDE